MPRILTFLLALSLFFTFFLNACKATELDTKIRYDSVKNDILPDFSHEGAGISRFVENSPYGWIDAAPGVRENGEENYFVKEYVIDENNDYYCVVDDILYSKDMSILYLYPPLKEGWYFQVPATVHTIGDCAFKGSLYLKEIVIPETVTNLDGDDTFSRSSVEIIHFPQSIETFDVIGLYHLPCIKKMIVPQGSIVEYHLMQMKDYLDFTDVIFLY